jgi:hypothetical protein
MIYLFRYILSCMHLKENLVCLIVEPRKKNIYNLMSEIIYAFHIRFSYI